MTKIENTAKGKYWDVGITLVSGCSNVSDSCKHCWSAGFAHRFRNNPFYTGLTDEKGCWNGHVRFNEHLLKRFERKTPTTFSIWNDLFHEGISFEQIYKTYGIIAQNQQHPVLVLTKRPEHALEFYNYYDNEVGMGYGRHIENHTIPPIPNLYLGVSVENQKTADERIPILLQIPAAVHFVSYEPALEYVDFREYLGRIEYRKCLNYAYWERGINWLIAGIETGHNARKAETDWFRRVRSQCIVAGVPYFLKKAPDGTRLLDGKEWSQYPEVK